MKLRIALSVPHLVAALVSALPSNQVIGRAAVPTPPAQHLALRNLTFPSSPLVRRYAFGLFSPGQACSNPDQCISQACINFVCAGAVAGRGCEADGDCLEGACQAGLCLFLQAGAPCSSTSQCASNLCATAPGGTGTTCLPISGSSGSTCSVANDCPSRRCNDGVCDVSNQGEVCGSNSDCGSSGPCANYRCRPMIVPCTDRTQCQGGICRSGYCFGRPDDPCNYDSDCASNFCDQDLGMCGSARAGSICATSQDCQSRFGCAVRSQCQNAFAPCCGGRALGEACSDPQDCYSHYCSRATCALAPLGTNCQSGDHLDFLDRFYFHKHGYSHRLFVDFHYHIYSYCCFHVFVCLSIYIFLFLFVYAHIFFFDHLWLVGFNSVVNIDHHIINGFSHYDYILQAGILLVHVDKPRSIFHEHNDQCGSGYCRKALLSDGVTRASTGTCDVKKANGSRCYQNGGCISGVCSSGVCVATTSSTSSRSTLTPTPTKPSSTTTSTTRTTSTTLLPSAAQCTTNTQCSSGYCRKPLLSDGVTRAATGTCDVKKASGAKCYQN
ncbi:Chitinase 4, partial [Tilletia horrida]